MSSATQMRGAKRCDRKGDSCAPLARSRKYTAAISARLADHIIQAMGRWDPRRKGCQKQHGRNQPEKNAVQTAQNDLVLRGMGDGMNREMQCFGQIFGSGDRISWVYGAGHDAGEIDHCRLRVRLLRRSSERK